MKATVTENVQQAIWGKTVMAIEASEPEVAELQAALAVVDKFKKVAWKKAGASKHADWTMVGYDVTSPTTVTVTITQGACG